MCRGRHLLVRVGVVAVIGDSDRDCGFFRLFRLYWVQLEMDLDVDILEDCIVNLDCDEG